VGGCFSFFFKERGEARWIAEVTVPRDCPFFAGHFPGAPVLPAVAQLELLLDLLEAAEGHRPLLTGVEGVRWRGAIHPGDRLEVVLARTDLGAAAFTITGPGGRVAGGALILDPRAR
jgi:3-hydroxymyristoyl/3-hydroxydecanoyl-(acyl carrier protein) dehydratase